MRWLVGQAVKTLASHAENMGSIPVRVTKTKGHPLRVSFLFCCDSVGIEPSTNASRVFVLWVRNIAPSSPPESLQDGANSRTKSRRLDAREIFRHQPSEERLVLFYHAPEIPVLVCRSHFLSSIRSATYNSSLHLLAWQYTASCMHLIVSFR